MRTSTFVQPTADIVTVVNLRPGDVYKRLEKRTYGETYVLTFGVVQDVMHNGEDAAITAVEFEQDWSGAEPKLKVFGTDTELRLFAAQPEEVSVHFAEVAEVARRAVETAERDLTKKREIVAAVERMTANLPNLTAADTRTVAAVEA